MSEAINPYAAPKALVEDVGDATHPEADRVRREHINHEASIKAVGVLYYLGAFFMVLGALVTLLNAFSQEGYAAVAISTGLAAVAVIYVIVGRGLRLLRSRARAPAIILSVIGLLGFPLGTLINAYVLWLLLCAKGQFIFTPEYAAIIEATPHVKYRTSIVVWILLGLVLTLIVAAIVLAAIKR